MTRWTLIYRLGRLHTKLTSYPVMEPLGVPVSEDERLQRAERALQRIISHGALENDDGRCRVRLMDCEAIAYEAIARNRGTWDQGDPYEPIARQVAAA